MSELRKSRIVRPRSDRMTADERMLRKMQRLLPRAKDKLAIDLAPKRSSLGSETAAVSNEVRSLGDGCFQHDNHIGRYE